MVHESFIPHPLENLHWLSRFRLAMFVAALVSILYVYFRSVAEVSLAFSGLAILLSLFIPLTNTFLLSSSLPIVSRSRREEETSLAQAGAQYVLAFDAFLLTLIFHLTGGAHNPFTVIYLAQLTLSLVTLGFQGSLPTFFVSTVGFVSLFLVGLQEQDVHTHHTVGESSSHAAHLEGMFVAFLLVAGLLLYFLRWMGREVARYHRLSLQGERERRERIQLLTLTALASQSAHELASPLSLIAVTVGELSHELQQRVDTEELLEEVALVKLEVERAKKLLDQMVVRGQSLQHDSSRNINLVELVQEIQRVVAEEFRGQVEFPEVGESLLELSLPLDLFANATRGVVKNSREAGATHLQILVSRREEYVAVEFADNGRGMSAQQLKRLGEPFISTKGVGEGMGLGIFILKLLAESVGGRVEFRALEPSGLSLTLLLPVRHLGAETKREAIYGHV